MTFTYTRGNASSYLFSGFIKQAYRTWGKALSQREAPEPAGLLPIPRCQEYCDEDIANNCSHNSSVSGASIPSL